MLFLNPLYYLSTHRYKNKTVDSPCLSVCLLFVYLSKMQSFTQNHLHTHTSYSIMQVFIVEIICDQNNKINSKYTHTHKEKGHNVITYLTARIRCHNPSLTTVVLYSILTSPDPRL